MTVKFITMKGASNLASAPFYRGGVEPGSSYSFALKKPGGTVIGTAEIVASE